MQSREHQYIFEPVCASVLVRRNASKEPLRSRNTPRIEGQVQLEPLSLRLSQVTLFFLFFLVPYVDLSFRLFSGTPRNIGPTLHVNMSTFCCLIDLCDDVSFYICFNVNIKSSYLQLVTFPGDFNQTGFGSFKIYYM